jgi:hypothetical protein
MKALTWDKGGPITIKINGQEHSPSLFSPDRSFGLFKIFEGESGLPYNVTIQNIQGKNYVEGLYVREKGLNLSTSISNKIILNSTLNQNAPNLIANSDFSIIDNKSGLPLYWNDSLNKCGHKFTCKINSTTGWSDKLSYQFSTKRPHNEIGVWSSIYGQEISVDPSKIYKLLTHMRINKYATQSHVLLEGFNDHSKKWYEIEKCPAGISGLLQWQQFSCEIKIPENTTKIRPVLNAGWSSQLNVARTWFDDLSLTLKDENESPNLAQIKKLILPEIGANNKSSSTIQEFNKVNPTLWNVHISTSKPTTIGFAEPYHQSWEAAVYKDGKKIDVVKSMPLYGAINAFQIKQTGSLDIVLSFAPQYWYQVGLVISGITFVFCIFYIVYDWRRNK